MEEIDDFDIIIKEEDIQIEECTLQDVSFNWTQHVEAIQAKDDKHYCNRCSYTTKWHFLLKNHIREEHKRIRNDFNCSIKFERALECPKCKRGFMSTVGFYKHMCRPVYQCPCCDYNCKVFYHIKEHLKVHHKRFWSEHESSILKMNISQLLKFLASSDITPSEVRPVTRALSKKVDDDLNSKRNSDRFNRRLRRESSASDLSSKNSPKKVTPRKQTAPEETDQEVAEIFNNNTTSVVEDEATRAQKIRMLGSLQLCERGSVPNVPFSPTNVRMTRLKAKSVIPFVQRYRHSEIDENERDARSKTTVPFNKQNEKLSKKGKRRGGRKPKESVGKIPTKIPIVRLERLDLCKLKDCTSSVTTTHNMEKTKRTSSIISVINKQIQDLTASAKKQIKNKVPLSEQEADAEIQSLLGNILAKKQGSDLVNNQPTTSKVVQKDKIRNIVSDISAKLQVPPKPTVQRNLLENANDQSSSNGETNAKTLQKNEPVQKRPLEMPKKHQSKSFSGSFPNKILDNEVEQITTAFQDNHEMDSRKRSKSVGFSLTTKRSRGRPLGAIKRPNSENPNDQSKKTGKISTETLRKNEQVQKSPLDIPRKSLTESFTNRTLDNEVEEITTSFQNNHEMDLLKRSKSVGSSLTAKRSRGRPPKRPNSTVPTEGPRPRTVCLRSRIVRTDVPPEFIRITRSRSRLMEKIESPNASKNDAIKPNSSHKNVKVTAPSLQPPLASLTPILNGAKKPRLDLSSNGNTEIAATKVQTAQMSVNKTNNNIQEMSGGPVLNKRPELNGPLGTKADVVGHAPSYSPAVPPRPSTSSIIQITPTTSQFNKNQSSAGAQTNSQPVYQTALPTPKRSTSSLARDPRLTKYNGRPTETFNNQIRTDNGNHGTAALQPTSRPIHGIVSNNRDVVAGPSTLKHPVSMTVTQVVRQVNAGNHTNPEYSKLDKVRPHSTTSQLQTPGANTVRSGGQSISTGQSVAQTIPNTRDNTPVGYFGAYSPPPLVPIGKEKEKETLSLSSRPSTTQAGSGYSRPAYFQATTSQLYQNTPNSNVGLGVLATLDFPAVQQTKTSRQLKPNNNPPVPVAQSKERLSFGGSQSTSHMASTRVPPVRNFPSADQSRTRQVYRAPSRTIHQTTSNLQFMPNNSPLPAPQVTVHKERTSMTSPQYVGQMARPTVPPMPPAKKSRLIDESPPIIIEFGRPAAQVAPTNLNIAPTRNSSSTVGHIGQVPTGNCNNPGGNRQARSIPVDQQYNAVPTMTRPQPAAQVKPNNQQVTSNTKDNASYAAKLQQMNLKYTQQVPPGCTITGPHPRSSQPLTQPQTTPSIPTIDLTDDDESDITFLNVSKPNLYNLMNFLPTAVPPNTVQGPGVCNNIYVANNVNMSTTYEVINVSQPVVNSVANIALRHSCTDCIFQTNNTELYKQHQWIMHGRIVH